MPTVETAIDDARRGSASARRVDQEGRLRPARVRGPVSGRGELSAEVQRELRRRVRDGFYDAPEVVEQLAAALLQCGDRDGRLIRPAD